MKVEAAMAVAAAVATGVETWAAATAVWVEDPPARWPGHCPAPEAFGRVLCTEPYHLPARSFDRS